MIIVTHGWAPFPGLFGAGLITMLLQALGLGVGVSLVIAGLALSAFGWWLNANSAERHRLFWIPLQWFGVFVVVVGVANDPKLIGFAIVIGVLGGALIWNQRKTNPQTPVFTSTHLAVLEKLGIEVSDDTSDARPEGQLPDEAPPRQLETPDRYSRRIDLIEGNGTCPELQLAVVPTAGDIPVARSTCDDEIVKLVVTADRLQLTGVRAGLHQPGQLPSRQCVADGAGVLVLTDQRVLGLVTESRSKGLTVKLDGLSSGPAIAFAVSRDDLVDLDLTRAKVGQRLHLATLYGEVTLRVRPRGVLGTDDEFRFPAPDEIERALTAFVVGESGCENDSPLVASDAEHDV